MTRPCHKRRGNCTGGGITIPRTDLLHLASVLALWAGCAIVCLSMVNKCSYKCSLPPAEKAYTLGLWLRPSSRGALCAGGAGERQRSPGC